MVEYPIISGSSNRNMTLLEIEDKELLNLIATNQEFWVIPTDRE